MAEGTVIPTPDLDTVELGLSPTIERDYIGRGVFVTLRSQNAVSWIGGSSFHHLTLKEADALLEDAQVRRGSVTNGLKAAYTAHLHTLRSVIEQAKARRKILEAKGPRCRYQSKDGEDWCGTKEQLMSMGICFDGPWPGELGSSKKRWAKVTDRRGYPVSLTRDSTTWGTFRARIDIPEKPLLTACHKKRSREIQEFQREPTLPKSSHLRLVWSASAA